LSESISKINFSRADFVHRCVAGRVYCVNVRVDQCSVKRLFVSNEVFILYNIFSLDKTESLLRASYLISITVGSRMGYILRRGTEGGIA
jgi:hypothetical protein